MTRVPLLALLCLAAAIGAAAQASSADAFRTVPETSYGSGGAPADAALERLDLYLPDAPAERMPIVAYVHGGAWAVGDKSNRIQDKARLFTDMGYVFASLNYRLSPGAVGPGGFDPARVRFPDHPRDVADAVGWLSRNAPSFGGDADRIALIGHSAGAHLASLVAVDPSYLAANGVFQEQVRGVVSLDTAAFDVVSKADGSRSGPGYERPELFWNAFATPAENAVDGAWAAGSPIRHASPGDPPHLLVTQAGAPLRIAENQAMAGALGQDPAGVVTVPLDHEGINRALGSPGDVTGETAAVASFVGSVLADAAPIGVRVTHRPPHRMRLANGKRRRKVSLRFRPVGPVAGFRCRLDRRRLAPCGSPFRRAVGRGRHSIAVRPVSPGGRLGKARVFRLRVEGFPPR